MSQKIILIEDDAAILDIYQMMIKKAGFDVQTFSSGQEFLDALKEMIKTGTKPALVLLDLILPDMSGEEILTTLKKGQETKDIKVFILTNKENPSDLMGEVKPDKYIIKANTPPTALIEIVKEQLK